MSVPQSSAGQPSSSRSFTANALASALSLGALNLSSQNIKSATLALTPHHLYYLLGQIEELGIAVGPMNIRLENIHADTSPANYVSFLSHSQRSRGSRCADRDSIHSVSSVRSVMSGVSSLWSGLGLGSPNIAVKTEKGKAQFSTDIKYLYSAFTKIPCLRLAPDRKARLIEGYEEFPFDTAVPLVAFKNVSVLEIFDVDFRQFCGWDKLAERLRSLTLTRANLEEPSDLLIGIVLDDMEKRRRRSSKAQLSPTTPSAASPSPRLGDQGEGSSAPGSPEIDEKLSESTSPQHAFMHQTKTDHPTPVRAIRTRSTSPTRTGGGSKSDDFVRHARVNAPREKRSGSGSSNSSSGSVGPFRSGSSSNLLSTMILPPSKWRFLRHLSIADNALTSLPALTLATLGSTLQSLDISSNLFTEVPDCLADLTALRALNTSNCMIETLHSIKRCPLPLLSALNLRANRLFSIAGIEFLSSLERLDLRENILQDPVEVARLTAIPHIQELWVARNPFTKSHTNYRITIFDLFRGAPSYTNDIVLDAQLPGYTEKRQLRERVVVTGPEAHPIITDARFEIPAMSTPIALRSETADAGRNVLPLAQKIRHPSPPDESPVQEAVSYSRRRKGTRRRIVDLAETNNAPKMHQITRENVSETPAVDTTMSTARDSLSTPSETSSLPFELSSRGHALASEIQTLALNGEVYRQKIEALKDEVGINWLNVLNDHSWSEREKKYNHLLPFGHPGVIRPNISHVTRANHGMIRTQGT